ncbi:hypothetical protein HK105_200119 [Polyrhizophydium stewartii]|uniref:FAS1 domain-containing protein n=1 Tax=Polyrhizophydium stewartii TaxID=2732419 RepID=A0ABR4NKK3_9FUNG|nr:hypothetical protein HK105_008116 [Polyrhizophydium stewartii]
MFIAKFLASAVALVASVSAQSALNIAASDPTFSTLVTLAGKFPDIVGVLNGTTTITVFAPTNDAFTKLQTTSPDVYKAVTSDDALLKKVLQYHVIAGSAFDPAKAPGRTIAKTANGAALRVDVDGAKVTLTFGLANSTVVKSATATNGVVHVVDTVLVPPGAVSATAVSAGLSSLVDSLKKVDFVSAVDGLTDVTIFAPTNAAFDDLTKFAAANNLTISSAILSAVLDFHVVKGAVYSSDIFKAATPIKATTAYNGATVDVAVDNGVVTVAGAGNKTPAKVVIADVLVAGGVVHLIDTVLLPDLAKITPGTGKDGINLPSFTPAGNGNGNAPTPTGTAGSKNSATKAGFASLAVALLAVGAHMLAL